MESLIEKPIPLKKIKRQDKIIKSRFFKHIIYADPNRWQADLNTGNHPDA